MTFFNNEKTRKDPKKFMEVAMCAFQVLLFP